MAWASPGTGSATGRQINQPSRVKLVTMFCPFDDVFARQWRCRRLRKEINFNCRRCVNRAIIGKGHGHRGGGEEKEEAKTKKDDT